MNTIYIPSNLYNIHCLAFEVFIDYIESFFWPQFKVQICLHSSSYSFTIFSSCGFPIGIFSKFNVCFVIFQDTNPLLAVVGRCCILEMDEYVKSRPTQYLEEDVHVCENVYDESRRVIRNLPPTGKTEKSIFVCKEF